MTPPIIDARLKPSTPEQIERAAKADLVFQLHNEYNKILSAAAFDIIDGAVLKARVQKMTADLLVALDEATQEILR